MANERRIIELVLKAVGERELKAITRDLVALRSEAQKSQAALSSIQSGLASFAKLAAGAVGIGTLVYGLRNMAQAGLQAIETMDALSVTISKVGVAAADFQKLQFAARLSNVEAETLNKGLVKLSVAIADVGGKSSAATKALRELGITSNTGVADAMARLADEFERLPDGATKTAKAVQYFGKAGAELIPLLNEGSEGLAAMYAEAEALGLVLSEEALAGANMFGDELDRLGAVIEADTQKLMGGLAPALITIAQLLTGAAANGLDFTVVGDAIGGMLIEVTAQLKQGAATLQAYGNAVVAFLKSMKQAIQGWDALLSGNVRASDLYMQAAKDNLTAAQIYWQNAEAIGRRAGQRVHDQYQANRAAIRAQADEMRRGGMGAADLEAGGGGGRGASGARDHARARRDEADAVNGVADAMANFNAQLADYGKWLDSVGQDAIDAQAERWEQEQQAWEKAQNAQAESMRKAQEQWGFLADAAGQATFDIISGAESISQAIKRMVASIIADLVRLGAQKLIMQLLGVSDFGNVGSNIFGRIFGTASASGNAFGSSGVISGPTLHGVRGGGIGIAGEAGPEAILPLQRNAQGQLGIAASGGLSVVVNNNVPGAAVQVRETDRGLQIDLVERQLADRIRRGGTALPGALENTYRTGRFASAY